MTQIGTRGSQITDKKEKKKQFNYLQNAEGPHHLPTENAKSKPHIWLMTIPSKYKAPPICYPIGSDSDVVQGATLMYIRRIKDFKILFVITGWVTRSYQWKTKKLHIKNLSCMYYILLNSEKILFYKVHTK